MKRYPLFLLLPVWGILLQSNVAADVLFDRDVPQVAMKNYSGGVMDTSTKYSVAHMYSSRRPQEWERRMAGEGWIKDYKAWLNLRNDDLFMHRFGSPDYARDFIRNMPHEHLRGFYMGSDGYFWGREFIAKEPILAGRLEIDKHWYNFRMFGELAYNNELEDDRPKI